MMHSASMDENLLRKPRCADRPAVEITNHYEEINRGVQSILSPVTIISAHLKPPNDKYRSSLHSDQESDSSEYATSASSTTRNCPQQKQRKFSMVRRLSLHRDVLMHRKLIRVGSEKRKMSDRLSTNRTQTLFSSLDCGNSPLKPKNLHLGHSAPNICYFADVDKCSSKGNSHLKSGRNSFSAYQVSRNKGLCSAKGSPRIIQLKARRMSGNSLVSSDWSCLMSPSSTISSMHSSQEVLDQNSEMDLFWGEIPDHYNHHHPHHHHRQNHNRNSPMSPFRQRSQSFNLKQLEPDSNLNALNEFYRSCFPKAIAQMELKLEKFLERCRCPDFHMAVKSDGSASFVLHQLVELATDCLEKSRFQLISSGYFSEMASGMQQLIENAKSKIHSNDLSVMIRELLMIISRPARLLECLEFDPNEFYKILEQGDVTQIKNDDVISYILQKMCIDKSSDKESKNENNSSDTSSGASAKESSTQNVASNEDKNEKATLAFANPPQEADFETVKLISNGAYGAVHLVRHRETRRLFAMKRLPKIDLVLRNLVDQVFAERDILTFTDNPFVVSFYCSFETKKHLCMVLEYVEGGDCGALLKNIGGPLPLDMSRLYFAETVLALEYLHSFGIVHRDLKPDNLLLTSTGHVKLTDFGLSKIGLMKMTTNLFEGTNEQFLDNQVFGTPEYIAPEVILRQGYGQTVDWWSMGVILYQFLVGCVPFTGDTTEQVFDEIVSGEILWPEEEEYRVCEEAQDIIESLLERDPFNRLGYTGALEVKGHAFFEDVDWSALLRQKTQFVPQLTDEEDTSYFDMRLDRYCHTLDDSCDEELEKSDLFRSFSTCSPRYSKTESTIFNNKERYSEVDSKTESPRPEPEYDWGATGRWKDSSFSPLPTADASFSSNASLPSRSNNKSCSSLHETSIVMENEQKLKLGKGLRPSVSLKRHRDRSNRSPSNASLANCSTPIKNKATHRLVRQLSRDSSGSSFDDCFHECLPKVVRVARGREGFGFSFRALKVLHEVTGKCSLEHVVVHVEKNGPAHDSGLCVGDVVTHVDGNKISGWPHRQVIKLLLQRQQGQQQLSPSILERKKRSLARAKAGAVDVNPAVGNGNPRNCKIRSDRETRGGGCNAGVVPPTKSKNVKRSRSLKLKMLSALGRCEKVEGKSTWYADAEEEEEEEEIAKVAASADADVGKKKEEEEEEEAATHVELRVMPTVKVKKTVKSSRKSSALLCRKRTIDVLMIAKSFHTFQEKSLCRMNKYQSMNCFEAFPTSPHHLVQSPGQRRPSSLVWGSRRENPVGPAVSPLVLCPSNGNCCRGAGFKLIRSGPNSLEHRKPSLADCHSCSCEPPNSVFFGPEHRTPEGSVERTDVAN